jgi:hypothetical protein
MKRIAIGAVAGLAVWFGSALAAEAQQIQPTGPLSVTTGQVQTTFTATLTLPNPANLIVKLWVYRSSGLWHFSQTMVVNPNVNTYYFSKVVDMTGWGLITGETLTFSSKLLIGGQIYTANDWQVVVSGTRPATKMTSAKKTSVLAVQNVDKDRRKE